MTPQEIKNSFAQIEAEIYLNLKNIFEITVSENHPDFGEVLDISELTSNDYKYLTLQYNEKKPMLISHNEQFYNYNVLTTEVLIDILVHFSELPLAKGYSFKIVDSENLEEDSEYHLKYEVNGEVIYSYVYTGYEPNIEEIKKDMVSHARSIR